MKKIGIWGWWWQWNLGDNWILATMLKIFGKECIPVVLEIIDFTGFDFMICGGGGLFSDHLTIPWNAEEITTPHGVFGVGTEFGVGDDNIKRLYRSSKFFYVRDKLTQKVFDISDDTSQIADVTFFDPVFVTRGPKKLKIALIWYRDLKVLTEWKDSWKNYIGEVVPAKVWAKQLSKRAYVDIFDFRTRGDDPVPFIQDYSLIVSQRYHGIVAAIQAGIPCIAIDVAPKIRGLMREIGFEEYCLRLTEFMELPLLYDRCMDNKKEIQNRMEIFTIEKMGKVRKAATRARELIQNS